jgi:transposase-like protein
MAKHQDTQLQGSTREALINDPDFLRDVVQGVLQRLLEEEMAQHLQAAPHERTDARKGYRNGYKPRQLKTRVGRLDLLVPQDRDGTFKTELFDRYQRSEKALVLSLMEMYVEGVSTRKVKDVTERLCGTSFSKSQVSRLTGGLDAELEAWRTRPLGDVTYPYLIVDARYEHVRVAGQVVAQGVLIVMGVRSDGRRDLLAVKVCDTESEATYDELFTDLKNRGLTGVQLVTSDEHRGLVAAVRKHFQGTAWQRCQVHFQRNALGKVARKHRKALTGDLKAVFAAPSKAWALEAAREVVERWSASHPAVAEWIDESIEDTLACFAFPEPHRRRIRTTNGLERFNQEIKRRSNVVRIFPNPDACLRLATALAAEQSEEWLSGRRYLDMSLLDEPAAPGPADRPDPEGQDKEAEAMAA